jgi:transcriptional regulator with XRE-family HTH domain
MTIGERIKERREMLNISQTDLAARVGISKQTLYKYENNIVTNIPSNIIELLAEQMECSPAYIMGWDFKYESKDEAEKRLLKRLSALSPDSFSDVIKYIDFLESKQNGGIS